MSGTGYPPTNRPHLDNLVPKGNLKHQSCQIIQSALIIWGSFLLELAKSLHYNIYIYIYIYIYTDLKFPEKVAIKLHIGKAIDWHKYRLTLCFLTIQELSLFYILLLKYESTLIAFQVLRFEYSTCCSATYRWLVQLICPSSTPDPDRAIEAV